MKTYTLLHRIGVGLLYIGLLSGIDVFASEDTQIISQLRDSYPQLSPDGQRIVFQSNRSGSNEIWVMQADGTQARQLTRIGGSGAETPKWSPDGRQIVYVTYIADGNNDVFVMDADGANPTQITFGPGYDGHPHWSADGSRIVFNSDRDTPDLTAEWHLRWHDIWSEKPDGSDLIKHTDCRTTCTYGSLSPDGKHLLYRRVDDKSGLNWLMHAGARNSEIYISAADGSNARVLAAHPAFDGWPAWSPDGQWIVFASNRTGPPLTSQLWLVKPDDSGLVQVTSGEWSHTQPAWTGSGDAFTAFRFLETETWELGGVVMLPVIPATD